jgi:hypothetical protein
MECGPGAKKLLHNYLLNGSFIFENRNNIPVEKPD